jgi:branched-chain amino acid aminotransferase
MKYAYFGGKIVPFEQAKVSVMTHALNYGTGIFEGIRAYYNPTTQQLNVLFLKEHYRRLLNNSKMLFMKIDETVEQLCDITVELLRKENYSEDVYIRPLLYKATPKIGISLKGVEDAITIFASPMGDYLDTQKGIRVTISSWRRIEDNAGPARAKMTGTYVGPALAKTEAIMNGYDEALVLTEAGHVCEGSAENLFIVRDNVIYTPPVYENILEGVTRKAIISLLQDELKLTVVERPIDRTELYICDEIFLTGTGAQVSSVTEVDHRLVGSGQIGAITAKLSKLYFDAVRGNNPKYQSWLTRI